MSTELFWLLVFIAWICYLIWGRRQSKNSRYGRFLGIFMSSEERDDYWAQEARKSELLAKNAKARAENAARNREQDLKDQTDPPWVSPRVVDERQNNWAYNALMDRLKMVREVYYGNERFVYYRDEETGQLWCNQAEERGYGNWVAWFCPAGEIPDDPPASQ